MIKQLSIKNFKSIKDLKLTCKKLNILIGEPNSGKSNIIEALSLQSQNAIGKELNKQIFRYKSIGDIFYDFNIHDPIELIADDRLTLLEYSIRDNGIPDNEFQYFFDKQFVTNQPIKMSHDGKVLNNGDINSTNLRYYEYKNITEFSNSYLPHLSVPHGENIPFLLISNAEHKRWVSDFLKSKGLMLTLKPTENDMLASKLVEDEIYSYPYLTLSETLQRIIFYSLAIKTNKESIILFDEPESNTFPFYTKELAERIALDETNQFFITTHNPYLLLSLIEKSKQDDVNVIIAQMKDYETKISILSENQITEVLDLNSDVFFNFDKILA